MADARLRRIRTVVTFEECNELTACPYCKAAIGEPCASRYQGKPSSDPHPSRARIALDKTEQAERTMKKMRKYQ